ncbi:MAG: alpha/beta fold hydrolase [Magnetococcales bacterium]|nr:alpha/beta fold hydrolase [Magnetococcales bacterium]
MRFELSPSLLLVHGWGFGAGVWHPVRRALAPAKVRTLDLGFYGSPNLTLPPEDSFVAVGHSLGFLWLTRQLEYPDFAARCRGLVAINGFCRFSRAPDYPLGVAGRILERMAARLKEEPVEVLSLFQRQGGLERPLSIPAESLNPHLLADGLNWLAEWDTRALLAAWTRPLLVIASSDDRVVTPEMTRAQFDHLTPNPLHWLPDGGHLLPLSRPERCASLIHSFFRACAS